MVTLKMTPRYRERGLAGNIRSFVRILADLVHAYRVLPNVVELADGSVWVKVSDGHGPPAASLRLPAENDFLTDEESREVRQETALELMDEDVYGYMLFLLKRDEDSNAELAFRAQTHSKWVTTFTAGFGHVLDGLGHAQAPR